MFLFLFLQVFGFLATVLFVIDAFWFVKTNGFPWKKDRKTESSNGGPAQPTEEAAKLNTEG